jgi:hypothetical protein
MAVSARKALEAVQTGSSSDLAPLIKAAATPLAEHAVISAVGVFASKPTARAWARAGSQATAANLARMSAGAAVRTAGRANVVATVGIGLAGQVADTYRLATGEIDGSEYGKRSAETAGATVGGVGGGYLGAAIGTAICPGIGTVLGVIIGGTLGSVGAQAGASALVR